MEFYLYLVKVIRKVSLDLHSALANRGLSNRCAAPAELIQADG